MLEASLDKLPEQYCWSYFMLFFWLILLFAVATKFVTFGLWNLLQYLSNITCFCCHTSGNFHQSCKILVLMKECDLNEEHNKHRMNSASFSSFYFPCWDCDQISKDVWKSVICCVSGKPNKLFSLEGVSLYVLGSLCSSSYWVPINAGPAMALCATSLPGPQPQPLFQNILWFLSSTYTAAVCNPYLAPFPSFLFLRPLHQLHQL